MGRISLALFVCGTFLVCSHAQAQCRGGGGQTGTTGTSAVANTLGTTAGGTTTGTGLLTSPGSFLHDVMVAQMLQRQLAQQQYMLAMQQQELRQHQLAARQDRAAKMRTQIAASRERSRALLAASSGRSSAPSPARYVASYQPIRK
jgi:hypothetical protein